MNTPLKALVAITCLALLGAVGWYAKTEIEARNEQAAKSSLNAEIRASIADNKCRSLISSWDNGGEDDIRAMYGENTDKAMRNCRTLIELRDR